MRPKLCRNPQSSTPVEDNYQDIVVATEEACRHLGEQKGASLHSEVAKTVKRAKPSRSNLTSDERQAIHELKGDRNIMILPADKGKAMVVMNSSDYKQKLNSV